MVYLITQEAVDIIPVTWRS